ncbi:hypothetical protein [Pontibacter russatus]|uniref:hypothetical protein n=1 Tax=Pontibacter russatus TaxID=2694929 RepID=UPI0013796A58|nr:hypothetical protein [Pontibacter russatus]
MIRLKAVKLKATAADYAHNQTFSAEQAAEGAWQLPCIWAEQLILYENMDHEIRGKGIEDLTVYTL